MLPVLRLELRDEHNNYLTARGSGGKMIECFRDLPLWPGNSLKMDWIIGGMIVGS